MVPRKAIIERLIKAKPPHVVQFFDVFEEGSFGFVVMQLADSRLDKLSAALYRKSADFFEKVAIYLAPVARALEYLHSENIVHRDVKPQNILLVSDIPCLSDLGAGRIFSDQNPATMIAVTPRIDAPEVGDPNKSRDPSRDIWSLGETAYWMLTGCWLWSTITDPYLLARAKNDRIGAEHAEKTRCIAAIASVEWREFIEKCLQIEPSDRPNATEAAEMLEKIASRISINEYYNKKKEILAKDSEIDSLKATISDLNTEIQTKDSEIDSLKATISDLNNKIQMKDSDMESSRIKNNRFSKKLALFFSIIASISLISILLLLYFDSLHDNIPVDPSHALLPLSSVQISIKRADYENYYKPLLPAEPEQASYYEQILSPLLDLTIEPYETPPLRWDRREVSVGEFAAWLSRNRVEADSPVGAAPGIHHGATGRLLVHDYPRLLQGTDRSWRAQANQERLPMTSLTAEAAQAYCQQRGGGTRLPTNREWLAAALGGDQQRAFPWGNDRPDRDKAHWAADAPKPVGEPAAGASPEGLYNLVDNVSEWVRRDWNEGEGYKVLGGSFRAATEIDLVPFVPRSPPADPPGVADDLGFRCVTELAAVDHDAARPLLSPLHGILAGLLAVLFALSGVLLMRVRRAGKVPNVQGTDRPLPRPAGGAP